MYTYACVCVCVFIYRRLMFGCVWNYLYVCRLGCSLVQLCVVDSHFRVEVSLRGRVLFFRTEMAWICRNLCMEEEPPYTELQNLLEAGLPSWFDAPHSTDERCVEDWKMPGKSEKLGCAAALGSSRKIPIAMQGQMFAEDCTHASVLRQASRGKPRIRIYPADETSRWSLAGEPTGCIENGIGCVLRWTNGIGRCLENGLLRCDAFSAPEIPQEFLAYVAIWRFPEIGVSTLKSSFINGI